MMLKGPLALAPWRADGYAEGVERFDMLSDYVGMSLSEAIRDLADAEVRANETRAALSAEGADDDPRHFRYLTWRHTDRQTYVYRLRLAACRVAEANYFLLGRGHTHPLIRFAYRAGDYVAIVRNPSDWRLHQRPAHL